MRNETTPKSYSLKKHKRPKKRKSKNVITIHRKPTEVPQSNSVDKTCVRHLAMLPDFVLHGSLNGSNGEFRRTFTRLEHGFHVNL